MAISQLGTLFTRLLKLEQCSNRSTRQKASCGSTNFTQISLTVASIPLEVHMMPLAVVQPRVASFYFDTARAHVHDHVEKAVQQLQCEEVSAGRLVRLHALKTAMAEQQ